MLRLDPVPVETPASVDEALALLATHGASAKVCAGGTDVIPNMKHGLHEPAVLVHIGKLTDLAFVRAHADALELGAMTTLWTLQQDAAVRAHVPALARAASLPERSPEALVNIACDARNCCASRASFTCAFTCA